MESALRPARKDLRLPWVRHLPGASGRERRAPSILRTGRHLDPESTAELLAATITHEATDARIRSRGIRSAQLLQPRIEPACRNAQLAFAVHCRTVTRQAFC